MWWNGCNGQPLCCHARLPLTSGQNMEIKTSTCFYYGSSGVNMLEPLLQERFFVQ